MPDPLLCVTVTGRTAGAIARAREAAEPDADLVEVRLDTMEHPDAAAALQGRRKPVIVTCRPSRAGGRFEGSDEDPDIPGLAVIRGRCRRLPPTLKVPHVGWNSLELLRPSRLLAGIPDGTQAYFTHSYAADITSEAVATTTHAAPFASVVDTDQVFGVQFHPEKSGESGVRILKNFVALCSRSV